jgi:DNA-binding transcriptional LysR family regulator
MPRENLNDLAAFLTVARERSFTKAAARLGVSQSAVSHTVRLLEARLGISLLVRTTRSVSPTPAGERLMHGIGAHFDEIDAQLGALYELRSEPTAAVRITASDHPIRSVLWPKLQSFLTRHPSVDVELVFDNELNDIVQDRLDAGVRLGDQVARDMISVRISPDIRFAVVGTPGYLLEHPAPEHPRDLVQHRCINLRLPTHGGLWLWEFEDEGHEVRVRVDGQLTFNSIYDIADAALAGFGLGYVPEDVVMPHIASGRLVRVLKPFCASWEGYHIYYPVRRQSSPVFSALIEALRHRGKV